MNITGQIDGKLRLLRLTGMLETLPVRLKQAEDGNSGYMDFLMSLLEDECERRQSGRLVKRLKAAGFEMRRPLRGLTSLLIRRFR